MGSKQVPLHATPVTGFQHPIKLSLINIQFQIMLNVVPNGVFGTTGQVVPTSGQVVETTCECSVVSTTDFYQLSGSVQLQI